LVLLDEAAQVSEELYYSVRPLLAVSGGQLILLSTPRGKQGIFWRAWDQEPDWKRVKVTADECPRISKEYLAQERRALPSAWFAQEYCCEFVQDEDSIFKERWVQYFDPEKRPYMDRIIQSWDTAQTKSGSSSYVVGQVWGCVGADFYLLDQVRGRLDFDETVRAIKDLSKKWPESTAKLVEAQALGAALVTHLKHKISGLIPITVKGSKETRARDCLPFWQSRNVYIPKPDDGEYAWVYEYLQELLNFPNADYDDQVDATTLALNQLQGTLFRPSKVRVIQNSTSQPLTPSPPLPEHYYFVGWVPGRSLYTVLVFDRTDYTDYKVVSFGRFPAESIEDQIAGVARAARHYNNAVVRAFDDRNEALVSALEAHGVYVERIARSERKYCYDNLALLIENDTITVPGYPELTAELDVFKSAPTYDESADYGLQVAQQSAIDALCLVTHDLTPGLIRYLTQPSIYYSYDPDFVKGGYFGPYFP
jgi:predicted phage terminase large subunit-like protein